MSTLAGLPGALRWYDVQTWRSWLRFHHRVSGDVYFVHADIVAARTLGGEDLVEVVTSMLPALCEQCGLALLAGEDILCRGCVDDGFRLLVETK